MRKSARVCGRPPSDSNVSKAFISGLRSASDDTVDEDDEWEPERKRKKAVHKKRAKRMVDVDRGNNASENCGAGGGKKRVRPTKRQGKKTVEAPSSDSNDSSDWEQVPDKPGQNADKDEMPSTSDVIPICIPGPSSRDGAMDLALMRSQKRLLSEARKIHTQLIEEEHKAHVLLMVAHCRNFSSACNDPLVRAVILSFLPRRFIDAPHFERDGAFYSRFMNWFRGVFTCSHEIADGMLLLNALQEYPASLTTVAMVQAFVAALRALGVKTRFACGFKPMPLGIPKSEPTNKRQKKNVPLDETGCCVYYWVELFNSSIEKWISVDPSQGLFDDADSIVAASGLPLAYVLAVDEGGSVVDATLKYTKLSLRELRQLRCDMGWWEETLAGLNANLRPEDMLSDEVDIVKRLHSAELPSRLDDYRGHPLYVLEKYLKKNEAFYPPDVEPVGIFKSHKVYPRWAVATLRTMDSWFKLGKVVNAGEQPYRFVPTGKGTTVETNTPRGQYLVEHSPGVTLPTFPALHDGQPLFGEWQVTDYKCPPVMNGKVPTNKYGTVYMFQPSMLPPGSTHLHVPGLKPVATELGVDCIPAVIGFQFVGKVSKPETDGFVVPSEHVDKLLDEWNKIEAINDAKRLEKRRLTALRNWRRLTKAILLRDRLQADAQFLNAS